MENRAVRVAVSGAAGHIGYSVLFHIASGAMLGQNQTLILQLLDTTPALGKLKGVAMELEDGAFPLLKDIVCSDDPKVAFKEADIALLVGASPRQPGMERNDLLKANSAIFTRHGKALDEVAAPHVKVLVVGNPANTNAYITMKSAAHLSPTQFAAMMRLDHNRALSLLAQKTKQPIGSIKKITVWGNHSSTQYPDLSYAEVGNEKAKTRINDPQWIEHVFIPTVQQRGASILQARGLSSAASAAWAIVSQIRDWVLGTSDGDWVTMGVLANGEYGYSDMMYGYPVTCQAGHYNIVTGLHINTLSRHYMDKSAQELQGERDTIAYVLN